MADRRDIMESPYERLCERLWYELQREIEALQTGEHVILNDEDRVDRPKIQCVPRYLGGMGFEKYFTPQIISFGPFHYDKPSVKVGKLYKFMWARMYLVHTINQEQLHHALLDRIYSLKDELDSVLLSDLTKPEDEGNLYFDNGNGDLWMWMWIMDGCSILQVLDKSYHDDPEQELKVSIDHLVRVHQDMLLLENQIPFKLLKLICNDNAKFYRCLHNFLEIHGFMITGKHDLLLENDHHIIVDEAVEEEDPIHLLDYLRRALLIKSSRDAIANHPQLHQQHADIKRSLHLRKYRIGSVRELQNTGIRVQKHSDDKVFHPIFNSDSGKLQLPQLTVDGSTMLIFLNLIAHEMCPDFRNDFEITSYVVFLSSLIETPEDVKELRSCGVIINELASDKEVSDLFNRMDTLLVPETSRYASIRDQMQQHFESNHSKIKMLGWMGGEAYISFLRSPWTVIALLAATLALTLTFIQTWFAIHPKGS